MTIVEKFNYEEFEKASIERLKKGEALLGKDGILTPLLKQFLEKAMEGEMEHHLDEAERSKGNRRNGKRKKQVRTSSGQFELETHRQTESQVFPGKNRFFLRF